MFWNVEGPCLEMYRAHTSFEKGENSLCILCFGVIKSRMGWGVWRLFFNTDEPIRWEEEAKTNVMKNSCNATCGKR